LIAVRRRNVIDLGLPKTIVNGAVLRFGVKGAKETFSAALNALASMRMELGLLSLT
jgi:hypothetical protein